MKIEARMSFRIANDELRVNLLLYFGDERQIALQIKWDQDYASK